MVLPLFRTAGMLRDMLRMDMAPAPTTHEQPAPDQPVDVPLRLPVQGPFANLVDVQVVVGLVKHLQDDLAHFRLILGAQGGMVFGVQAILHVSTSSFPRWAFPPLHSRFIPRFIYGIQNTLSIKGIGFFGAAMKRMLRGFCALRCEFPRFIVPFDT